MPVELKYRGRVITPEDITFLRRFIAEHPDMSRRKLSAKICEAWQWKQANGALRDMVCRGLLLMLHRTGEIELPAVRFITRNPLVERERPAPMLIDTTPITAALSELRPIEVQQVRRTGDEPLFNSLIEHYHYLGYEQPVRRTPQISFVGAGPADRVYGVEFGAASFGQSRPVHRLEHGNAQAKHPPDRV
jgi:hypothetical protein